MLKFKLREWSSLPIGPEGVREDQADLLQNAAIRAAKRLRLPEKAVLARGYRRLEAKQVCGIISVSGCSLEILPKIGGEDGSVRTTLVRMIAVAFDLPLVEGQITALGQQDGDLLDAFVNLFVTQLSEQSKAGLTRAYVVEDDALPMLRGKLDVRQQVVKGLLAPSRVYCHFEELTENTALNRLFKACVTSLAPVVKSDGLRRRMLALADRLQNVPNSRDPLREPIVWDRMNERFRAAERLARMLLEAKWQSTTMGNSTGIALLFPMNSLFERYVARWLERVLPQGTVSIQRREHSLLQNGGYALIPDIVIKTDDGPLIIDTKWKDVLDAAGKPSGVSQGDLYQLASYGHVYQAPRVILLYPSTGIGTEPTVWRYTGTQRQVEVWHVDLMQQRHRQSWDEFAQAIIRRPIQLAHS